jgi:PTH1 family peptidyl-tRNA hydrolase
MFVVCGLGNPGPQYSKTRHNVGFLFVDYLAQEMKVPLNQMKHGGIFGRGRLGGFDLILFQPQSYMNLSGRPVLDLMQFYKLSTSSLVCICDDLDQAPMAVKARKGGGHGGNNGLRDLLATLPDDGFHRIKIGIGKPEHKGQTKDWVLGSFSESELEILHKEVFQVAKDRLFLILRQLSKNS